MGEVKRSLHMQAAVGQAKESHVKDLLDCDQCEARQACPKPTSSGDLHDVLKNQNPWH